MIELIAVVAIKILYFIHSQAAEITHFMTEINIMLLITSLFRCMRGEYQSFFYVTKIITKFFIQIKCC